MTKKIDFIVAQQRVYNSQEGPNWYSMFAIIVFDDGSQKWIRRRVRRTLWDAVTVLMDELRRKKYEYDSNRIFTIEEKVDKPQDLFRKDWSIKNYWSTTWGSTLGTLTTDEGVYSDKYNEGEIE